MTSNIKSIHFIGIGGTAMAAVAAAIRQRGYEITGSDKGVYPPMSDFLERNNIQYFNGYDESNLSRHPDLVVIGNAISRGNPEVEYILDHKLRYTSLAELLKTHFLQGKRSIVVTGTHGKTSVTSLLTWVLEHNGLNPGFLIGGLAENLGQGARFTDSEWFVIEGDEYDTAFFDKRSKFVHYLPEIAIVNNLEFDHADIFPDLNAICYMFERFVHLLPRNGLMIANGEDANVAALIPLAHCPVRRFGFSEPCDDVAEAIELLPDRSTFQLQGFQYTLPMVGALNVRNALPVVACALHCGLRPGQIQSAFETFRGIKRRMQVRGARNGTIVIDDFAHHPTAIRETLKALRIQYPNQLLWAIFEPRSNTTRRSIFQTELADALSLADTVIVSNVARLELLQPSERLDPGRLIETIRSNGKAAHFMPQVSEIVDYVRQHTGPNDVVCVLSNGGFENIHNRLLDEV